VRCALREDEAGELRLSIGRQRFVPLLGLEVRDVDVSLPCDEARYADDARIASLEQNGKEMGGQREMAQMIGAQLKLEAVSCHAACRGRHDPRIVDEDVQAFPLVAQPSSELLHGVEAGEIDRLFGSDNQPTVRSSLS
jgi:hypothetical protein